MIFMRFFTSFFALFLLISCSASYEELMRSNFDPKDEFSKYLLIAYKEKAEFEAKEMHDWNSAKLYSEKALQAAKGNKIFPEHISYWKIPLNKSLKNTGKEHLELIKAYNNIMVIYDDAALLDPFNLAKGISSLDCWSEQQEENWQIWDIDKCRNDYLDAMHALYNSIAEHQNENIKKINSDSQKNKDIAKDIALEITEDNNENIIQVIYFDFDKSILSSVSKDEIYNFIKLHKENIKNYFVEGHTDTKGTKKYNQILSNERAEAIKLILIELGIEAKNIKIIGKGESDLRVKTKDEVAHPANRRAEISPLN